MESWIRASLRLHLTSLGKKVFILTNHFSLFPKVVETQAFIKFYDKNGDGSISFPEFVEGLREPLYDRRKKIARKAFNSVAKEDKI